MTSDPSTIDETAGAEPGDPDPEPRPAAEGDARRAPARPARRHRGRPGENVACEDRVTAPRRRASTAAARRGPSPGPAPTSTPAPGSGVHDLHAALSTLVGEQTVDALGTWHALLASGSWPEVIAVQHGYLGRSLERGLARVAAVGAAFSRVTLDSLGRS